MPGRRVRGRQGTRDVAVVVHDEAGQCGHYGPLLGAALVVAVRRTEGLRTRCLAAGLLYSKLE